MRQLLQNHRTGELRVEEIPAPALQPGRVIVRNHYSLVRAGTERATVGFARQSLLGKARDRPVLVRQVVRRARSARVRETYRSVMARLDQFAPLGYSCAGEGQEIGEDIDSVAPGDLVACAGAGFANHAEVVSVPRNSVAKLPAGVSPAQGAFAAPRAIAMQGIRRAELTPGESVTLIGLGLLEQFTV